MLERYHSAIQIEDDSENKSNNQVADATSKESVAHQTHAYHKPGILDQEHFDSFIVRVGLRWVSYRY